MHLNEWYAQRGLSFLIRRAAMLLNRYGFSPHKSIQRIDSVVRVLADLGCQLTFPTPGIVVERHPKFIRHLQNAGAEIAVHSYQHTDLRALPIEKGLQQLSQAVQAFERCGIEVRGFRAPYTSVSQELLEALPPGLFQYSSNQTIDWGPASFGDTKPRKIVLGTISRLYRAKPANSTLCTPFTCPTLLEIPVCTPDDFQFHDGLNFGSTEIGNAWIDILHRIHQRGEIFTLIFHPELASLCEKSFIMLVNEARRLEPAVWISRLRDISDWWKEKSNFTVEMSQASNGSHLSFKCSPRATILAKGLDLKGIAVDWDGAYQQLLVNELDIGDSPLPIIGLSAHVLSQTASFLREQGYIVNIDPDASRYSIYLDPATLSSIENEYRLIQFIEASNRPLVRFWRWPNGAKCALSLTGDLDALSLLDYGSRLFSV